MMRSKWCITVSPFHLTFVQHFESPFQLEGNICRKQMYVEVNTMVSTDYFRTQTNRLFPKAMVLLSFRVVSVISTWDVQGIPILPYFPVHCTHDITEESHMLLRTTAVRCMLMLSRAVAECKAGGCTCHGGTPTWMVCDGKSQRKWMILGYFRVP